VKTPTLPGLQAAFHHHLLNLPSDIGENVVDGGRIGIEHRLHIYHNAYRMRLLENLQDAFEKTWAYLGDESFESSALAFIEEHPPQHRSLRWHGAEFASWLANRFPHDPDIAELAMIDWELRRAFDGPNARPIQSADLAGLTAQQWETVCFQFVPTFFIAPLHYNTINIWHAIDRGQTPPGAETLPDASWLLLWRKGWQPHFRTIGPLEQASLSQLHAGASFAQVCAKLSEQYSDQETSALVAVNLRTWLQDELIAGLLNT